MSSRTTTSFMTFLQPFVEGDRADELQSISPSEEPQGLPHEPRRWKHVGCYSQMPQYHDDDLQKCKSKFLNATHHTRALPLPFSNMETMMAILAFTICALLLLISPAGAQTIAIPENAHAKSYSDGWECDRGYRVDGEVCAVIDVPENAYKTNSTYGTGWSCLHGFRETDGPECVEVVVPEGGFLDPSGVRWHCLRGYEKSDDTCMKISLPENAYLSSGLYGSSWHCERGFDVVEDTCSAIEVPENAFLNTSGYGKPWICERGFFEKDDTCLAVVIPTNAYFYDTSYNQGWKCERGYAASGDHCEEIDIPANAHLDRSGNRWDCHSNYQKSKGLCVLRN